MSKQHKIKVTGHTRDGQKIVGPGINDFSHYVSRLFTYLKIRRYSCEGTVKKVSAERLNLAIEMAQNDLAELKLEYPKLVAERDALRTSDGSKNTQTDHPELERIHIPGLTSGGGALNLVGLIRRRLFPDPLVEAEWWIKVNRKNRRYLTKLISFFRQCLASKVYMITLP